MLLVLSKHLCHVVMSPQAIRESAVGQQGEGEALAVVASEEGFKTHGKCSCL